MKTVKTSIRCLYSGSSARFCSDSRCIRSFNSASNFFFSWSRLS